MTCSYPYPSRYTERLDEDVQTVKSRAGWPVFKPAVEGAGNNYDADAIRQAGEFAEDRPASELHQQVYQARQAAERYGDVTDAALEAHMEAAATWGRVLDDQRSVIVLLAYLEQFYKEYAERLETIIERRESYE